MPSKDAKSSFTLPNPSFFAKSAKFTEDIPAFHPENPGASNQDHADAWNKIAPGNPIRGTQKPPGAIATDGMRESALRSDHADLVRNIRIVDMGHPHHEIAANEGSACVESRLVFARELSVLSGEPMPFLRQNGRKVF